MISKNASKSIQKKIKEEGFHWGMKNKKHTQKSITKIRLSVIKYIEKFKLNGMPLKPRIGKNEKEILDSIEKQIGFNIKRQFAINGYFIDGYITELRLAIEIDEPFHTTQMDNDIKRQEEIEKLLNCKFIRIQS